MHRVLVSALLAFAAAPCVATAQAEPAATSRARERAQRLQRAVDEMVALVEEHAELKFKEPPRVRAATHKQWRAIVKREFELEKGRDIFEMSLSTQGLYLPETKEVVLSPLVVAPLLVELDDDAPRHKRLARSHQQATVAHELVHALQEQRFGLASKLEASEAPDEVTRFKWLLEGHAVLVEERIAERALGIEDFMLTGPYGGLAVGVDASYVRGRNYFLHVLRAEGMQGVHTRLQRPPTLAAMQELAKRRPPPAPREAEGGAESTEHEASTERKGAGKRRRGNHP